MDQPRLSIPLLVGMAFTLGCGGGKSTLPPGRSASATDFCTSIIQVATSMQMRCLGGEEAWWKKLYGQIFDCSKLARDVADGVLGYDAQKGAQCLEQINQLACDQSGDDPAACKGAIVGSVASGGACASGMGLTPFTDCAPGNHCDLDLTTCGGTCKPYAQVGASCAYTPASGSIECADGSSCQVNTQLCVADVAEGRPCQGPTAGSCAEGLYCEGSSTTAAGVCRKGKTSGACADGTECANDYRCIGVDGSKTCSKAKLPGDACTPGRGECFSFFAWCSDGRCIDLRATENQPCGTVNGETIQCEDGLACVYSSSAGICQKRGDKPAGSPCSTSVECAGTVAYCHPTTRVCVAC